MNTNVKKVYFFELRSDPGKFIAATFGESGYCTTTVYDQKHADVLNERQGISKAEVMTAEACSMFGGWDSFDEKVALYEGVADEYTGGT